jgi:hypothetical protein
MRVDIEGDDEALPLPQQRRREPPNANVTSDDEHHVDPETERTPLVRAMKESAYTWPFDRNTNRSTWEGRTRRRAQARLIRLRPPAATAPPASAPERLCPNGSRRRKMAITRVATRQLLEKPGTRPMGGKK